MAETYCGKACAECAQREQMNCPGCKTGPGRELGGDCNLAKCVRNKGHETCGTCCFRDTCGTLRGRDGIPDQRRRRAEAEQAKMEAIARRAPFLGKWLWLLFWLVVPSSIGAVLNLTESLQWLYLPGQIIGLACTVGYGLILLKLGGEEDSYRIAAICVLAAGAVNVLVDLFTGSGETPPWTLLLILPAAVVGLVGTYNEFMAHAAVLRGVDDELSGKWEILWKWHIGLYVAIFGCILALFLFPVLALVALVAVAIGLIVVAVLQLVYLYRTAKIFREYPAQ